jgi:hypothetical protein
VSKNGLKEEGQVLLRRSLDLTIACRGALGGFQRKGTGNFFITTARTVGFRAAEVHIRHDRNGSIAGAEYWLPNRGKTGHFWELAVPLAQLGSRHASNVIGKANMREYTAVQPHSSLG